MKIKEKLFTNVSYNGQTYFVYGPNISSLDIDQSTKQGLNCYLLTKPIEQADSNDVIECVDPIKVWFSNFQIYKHILRKMYGEEVFSILKQARWDFLNSNKNRFRLIYVSVGDYGCYEDEFNVVCFDAVNSEYVEMKLVGDTFEICKLKTNETNAEKIIDEFKTLGILIEKNLCKGSREGISYTLNNKDYKPLFLLYMFLRKFYFYYLVDGDLISWF